MLIGELARACGVGKDTIRHYEGMGLVQSRRRSAGSRSYAEYDERYVEIVRYIRRVQALGFRLSEIKPFVRVYLEGKLDAKAKLAALSPKINELKEKRRQIDELINYLERKIEVLVGQ